jgi:hypothetical protein
MVSPAYTNQSSWDLYKFFVFTQTTSEGICDALLAVSEAMRQFAPDTLMPEPALVELGKHISEQTHKFIRDDIPDLVQYQRGLDMNVWSNQYLASRSLGLKRSIEKVTTRFIEDLAKSFSGSSTKWTYKPDLVHDAFKELAVGFEDALGREYDGHQLTVAASAANPVATLSASIYTLSISSPQSAGSATSAANITSGCSSSIDYCFNCSRPGHWSSDCPYPKKGSTTPSKSPSVMSCYNCGKTGHRASNCPSSQRESTTPPRLSATSPRGDCFTCGQSGHWSSSCRSPRRGSATTPSRTPSTDNCFSCGQTGHWSSNCPRSRQESATPSRSTSGGKCFSCGKTGHWSRDCPTHRGR